MELRERLTNDLQDAIRSGDERRKLVMRSIKTAVVRAEKAGDEQITLDDAGILAVIAKEAKQRRESIVEFEKAHRPELVQIEQEELQILESYLPKQMDKSEIESTARSAITEVEAKSVSQMGAVMKVLMPRLKGQADGRIVQQIVRDLLSGTRDAQ
jgi:uncharacterized protein